MSSVLLTRDSPAEGVFVFQRRGSFRYAMDPILLVGWALEGGPARTFLDVGTGSGVMALLLTQRGLKGEGIDVIPDWIHLARRSARESGLQVPFHHMDARNLSQGEVDIVVCNPPYFPLACGTPPTDPLRAAARFECHGSLSDMIDACCRSGRRVCLSLPQGRLEEGRALLADHGRPVARELLFEEGFGLLEGRLEGSKHQVERGSLREGDSHGPLAARLFHSAGARLGSRAPTRQTG